MKQKSIKFFIIVSLFFNAGLMSGAAGKGKSKLKCPKPEFVLVGTAVCAFAGMIILSAIEDHHAGVMPYTNLRSSQDQFRKKFTNKPPQSTQTQKKSGIAKVKAWQKEKYFDSNWLEIDGASPTYRGDPKEFEEWFHYGLNNCTHLRGYNRAKLNKNQAIAHGTGVVYCKKKPATNNPKQQKSKK